MKILKALFSLALISLTVACTTTPQQPVLFSPEVASENVSITVTMTELPDPNMDYPGAGCLLCLGVAAAANSDLSKYTKTLPIDDLAVIGEQVTSALEAKGYEVNLASEPLVIKELRKPANKDMNMASKDYTVLQKELGTSHLLVIKLDSIGMSRNYSSYIPTSLPYINITGAAYLVNLETNLYDWYLPIIQREFSEGEWNEKPDYPSLSNAYFGAIERVRESILLGIN